MIRRPPRSTRTDTLFPYTTLFRAGFGHHVDHPVRSPETDLDTEPEGCTFAARTQRFRRRLCVERLVELVEIGRAHVRTPVTNAHLVCRLLLEKKNKQSMFKQQLTSTHNEQQHILTNSNIITI